MLKCPKCNEKLIQGKHSYQCIHHHTFDIARSGYVNL
ncbi:putative RNA methyltransferase, partial [Floccifex porci]